MEMDLVVQKQLLNDDDISNLYDSSINPTVVKDGLFSKDELKGIFEDAMRVAKDETMILGGMNRDIFSWKNENIRGDRIKWLNSETMLANNLTHIMKYIRSVDETCQNIIKNSPLQNELSLNMQKSVQLAMYVCDTIIPIFNFALI